MGSFPETYNDPCSVTWTNIQYLQLLSSMSHTRYFKMLFETFKNVSNNILKFKCPGLLRLSL